MISPLSALIIRKPWIDRILAGEKTWELRTKRTGKRGVIALIEGGSGLIRGLCVLEDCLPPQSEAMLLESVAFHGVREEEIEGAMAAGWRVPWVLNSVCALPAPIPYRHPSGCVTWVTLSEEETLAVCAAVPLGWGLIDAGAQGRRYSDADNLSPAAE